MMQITKTEEWRAIIKQMREELEGLRDGVLAAASIDNDVPKKFGIYDGYRRAIERLESFGREYDG